MWEPFQWPRGSTPPDRITASPPTLYRMYDKIPHNPSLASYSPEQYRLKWNNHSNNLSTAICDQFYVTPNLEGAPYTDVTIVCGDGVRLHAHRLILSASSRYFHDIFKSTSDQCSANSHSYVILEDIESSDMKLLLQYMYKGEVTVAKCQAGKLIGLANSLKVRGLVEDFVEKDNPSFSDLHPQEQTEPKRWEDQKSLNLVADATKASLSSEPKVFSSPLDSKFSHPLSESLREKLRSRSSTPVSRSHSPLGHKFLKEGVAIKTESDNVKTEPDHQSSTHSQRTRSRSPSTCPTSPTYHKPSFDLSRDTNQSLQQSYRTSSPPHHQSRMILDNKQILDYSRNSLFLDHHLHHGIKPHATSPYSDEEMFLNRRDIAPSPSLHQTATSALNLKIPHSTTSPPSPSSPSKRKHFSSSLHPSGINPPSLHTPHYTGGLHFGHLGLPQLPMFTMGYPHLDSLIAKTSNPDTPRGLSVKKDLGMTEDDKPASAKRQKLMENGPGFKDFDVNSYLKLNSSPDSFRRNSPSAGHHFDKRGDGASPTSTSNVPRSKISTTHGNLLPAFSSNSIPTTISSAHHNAGASIHTNNADSPYPHHPGADSYTTNGPTVETPATGASGSVNSSGNSNGSSASHNNTNGGSGKTAYNGHFVNYTGAAPGKPAEWKRYKQYSKSDLMMAIEEVKNGTTALQASRKYKVPSRTLYDKIKKLGITANPRRNISTGGTNNKLRNHQVKSDYNIAANMDRIDGIEHLEHALHGGSSGGGLVSESGVGEGGPIASCLAGSSLKADSLMRYDSSRPHSVESSATNDSFHPLDLQVSKTTANEITAKFADLYSKFPGIRSHMDQMTRYQMESANRYPHELNSDSRLHHPFAPKSILDMLPRQADAPAIDSLRSALINSDPSDISKGYEYFEQLRAQMNLIQSQLKEDQENRDSHETSHPTSLEQLQHFNDEKHYKGNETDDDSEIVVDNSDEHEKKVNSSTDLKGDDTIEDKAAKSEFRSRSPRVPEERNDNDTAYISHSTSGTTGPSSSDSPPSSSFNMADSGHDSNNTSATSDNEGRHQILGGIKIKHPKSSPEIMCAMTSRPSDASPKTSETSISGSDASPIISDKGPITLDSDSEIGSERSSKTTTGSYKVVSDIGLCSQVRPLDLRETSVTMSIPQESV